MQYKRYMRQLREKFSAAGSAWGKYVVVTNVNSSTIDKIANCSENDTMHKMVTLEFLMAIREVIVRLPGHNVGLVKSLGTATFSVPRVRSKQDDAALKPSTR